MIDLNFESGLALIGDVSSPKSPLPASLLLIKVMRYSQLFLFVYTAGDVLGSNAVHV